MKIIAISAISAYERGEDGKLCSIRICDYAGWEKLLIGLRFQMPPLKKHERLIMWKPIRLMSE